MKRITNAVGLVVLLALVLTLLPLPASAQDEIVCEYDVIVQGDDWLLNIAEKFYGNALAYAAIAEATNTKAAEDSSYATITDVNVIEPGSRLCLPSAEDVQAIAATIVKRGGVLVHTDVAHDSFDPHVSFRNITPTMDALFNSLTRAYVNPTTGETRLEGELAESWEISPDGLEVTFKLRPGVKFHDGSDWNAEVAQWNILRMRDDEMSGSKDLFTTVEDVEVVDPMTIKVVMNAPNVSFPALMSVSGTRGRARMISKEAMETLGPEEFARNPVGSGPFKFVEWVQDDRVVLERFEDYWEIGADGLPLPYLDGVTFREITDEATILAEMRAGTIHVMQTQVPGPIIASVEADPNLDVVEFAWTGAAYLIGANAKNGPFAEHPELRHAVGYAVDRDALVTTLAADRGYPAFQAFPPDTMGYNPEATYTYDPAQAKELVAEAGFADGLDINLQTWNRDSWIRYAEVLKQQLEAIGMRVSIEALEGLAWREQAQSNEGYDLALWNIDYSFDPDAQSRGMTSIGQGNWMGFDLPELDACMAEGRSTVDPEARNLVYQQCSKIFFDEGYNIFTYVAYPNRAVRTEVEGLRFEWADQDITAAWLNQ